MGEVKQIKRVAVDKLIPYVNNAKQHSEEQITRLASSIREFGFVNPVLVDKDLNVIAGHGRIAAAKKLDLKEVPCLFVEGLTDAQRKAYILADNRLGELADWDMELVTSELEALQEIDFDIDLTGFELPEEETTPEVTEDEVPEEVETRAKVGDLWKLGGHRLICGDSTDVAVIDRLMDGQKADLIYTDPPYGMNAVSNSGKLQEHYDGDILGDDDNTVAVAAFNMAQSYFKDTKQIWWGANYYAECLPSSECWIVWDKANGASDQTDCELAFTNLRSVVRQFTMASEKTNRVHPTQKPVKLFAQILQKFDKDNSKINIVDIFGGSGSTLIGCEQLGRRCFMCELDPHYVDVIIQRWENLTGQKAELINE